MPPIIRDAVAVLQRTAAIVGSSYLLHREANRPDRPVAYLFPRLMLNRYVAIADLDGEWRKALPVGARRQVLCPHMLKNSLAFELRRVDCGIPAITIQLQHKSFLDRRINPVTVAYGQLDRNAASKAAEDANLAYAKELFHPDAYRTGGGAKEFSERLRAKFVGYAESGVTDMEAIQHFVADGLPPLADVGLGYCLGRRKIIVDGKEQDPPCIGSLRCNPMDCTNGVIPTSKKPIWIKLAKENRARAEDPELFYLKATCEAMADVAERVVRELGKP